MPLVTLVTLVPLVLLVLLVPLVLLVTLVLLVPLVLLEIAVQEEVVRILDKFTALEAELGCRKRQYQYYCASLHGIDISL